MCQCVSETDIRERCLPNRNMQNFKDCSMMCDTAIWLFENNSLYSERVEGANTYKQEAVILRSFIDKKLKLRPLVYKRAIILDYIYKVFEEDVDKFIYKLLFNGEHTNITRECFVEILKNHSIYKRIKQVIKFDLLTIEYHIEDIWDKNEDRFQDLSEDSKEEEEDEDEEEPNLIKTKCGCKIIRDSKKHDLCVCDDNGENWVCADCYSDKD